MRRMREDDQNYQGVDYQGRASSSDLLDDSCPASSVTEWTNEKHCLYLKSMEASFINHLHSSMAGSHSYKKFDSPQAQYQIKTCRDVHGSRKTFGVFKCGSKSGVRISKSRSWIRHYRHRDKNQVLRGTISQDIRENQDQEFESKFKPFLGLVKNSKQSATRQSVLCRQNAVGYSTESSLRRPKLKRTETTSSEDNDQVAPISRPKEMRMR